MPNIGTMLRDEISRLSRRESRSQVDATKKATAQHRRDIAALKRQIALLERQVKLLAQRFLGASTEVSVDKAAARVRFSGKGLRAHRKRLGLSQAAMGTLLGVSTQSIYNWESESASPRHEQLERLATLRTLGKREAARRLNSLNGANGKNRHKR